MQTQEMLQHSRELHQTMAKALEIAKRLQSKLPELEEPAIRAQCSVIYAFLQQAERQEALLTQMLQSRVAQ
ncbi:MAG: hypothetical protein AAFV07_08085 [Bacteroidota bacterium]